MLPGIARRVARKLRRTLRVNPAVPASPALADYILSFCSASPEARAYAEMHLGRFVRTLELIPRGAPNQRILEMGAYMQITPALKTKLGYGEVTGCYLGPLGKSDAKSVTSTAGETFSCTIDLFDAESDVYPYAEETFDTVVCCELLEHLSEDPMHLVWQVNRILKAGGTFVLSTPNICALRAVKAVLYRYHPAIFAQYTAREGGNRVAPRHAREYTPDEIEDLMQAGGFKVEHIETGPYGLAPVEDYKWAEDVLRSQGMTTELRDDCIHVVAKKIGVAQERYPDWLYTK
jgi:SAM-dependent methyltransferase